MCKDYFLAGGRGPAVGVAKPVACVGLAVVWHAVTNIFLGAPTACGCYTAVAKRRTRGAASKARAAQSSRGPCRGRGEFGWDIDDLVAVFEESLRGRSRPARVRRRVAIGARGGVSLAIAGNLYRFRAWTT